MMWIFGIVLGLIAVRTAGRGSFRLGVSTVLAQLLLVTLTIVPVTYLAYGHTWESEQWMRAFRAARESMTAMNNALFFIFGLVSAYRVATRIHVRPPGT